MKFKVFCLLMCVVGLDLPVSAQGLPDIERLLESNSIESTEDGYEEMVNTLSRLLAEPVNVNRAGFDSLKMLFLLSDSQIDQILAFRKKHGDFIHINELLWVPGIGRNDLDNIRSFITLGVLDPQQRLAAIRKRTRQEVIARGRISLPLQEGYRIYSPDEFETKKEYDRKAENRFHGSPVGALLKFKFNLAEHLQAGLVLENDPGEGYFTRNQKAGFDFCSAHVKVVTSGAIRQLVLGDYRLQWGQGLLTWGGFASGKSDVAVGNEKSGKGVSAYSSTDENNYLRGVALTLNPVRNLTTDLFFSYKKTDGNVTPADTLAEEDLLAVSLYESGYHRNNSECRKKHALKELTTGLSLHWNSVYYKVGMNVLYYDFTPALIPGDRVYQQYNDTGNKRWLASVDYKTAWRGIYLFGETAVSDEGAFATVDGVRMSSSLISGSLLYRRYDKQYVSRYAAGFGEYSNTSNEEGVYIGIDLAPLRNLKVNLYYDWFHFFSPRYLSTIPGAGWEGLAEATYHHSRFEHILRFKHEVKPEDLKGKGSIRREKSEYRYQCNYKITDLLEMRTRFSFSRYHKDIVKESGYMVYQDVIWGTRKADFKMQYRLAYFDTDSYQSRIYAYENNVLYGYSFPAFMGKGWRTYLNLSWKPLGKLTCYFKTGFTIYPDRDAISSGVTKVDGNKLYDITLQVRLYF